MKTETLDITTKVPIVNMVKELKSVQRLMKADPAHEPHFINDPYVAIARKLLPWQYEKSWIEYEHKHFHGRFIANHVLLLKRRENTKMWKTANRFDFENIKTDVKQGALFAAPSASFKRK